MTAKEARATGQPVPAGVPDHAVYRVTGVGDMYPHADDPDTATIQLDGFWEWAETHDLH